MDKISKISPKIFRLDQACVEKTKICSDCPSGPPKCQICLDWPIRLQEMLNLSGLAPKLPFLCKYTNKLCHNSFPVHPISIGTCCTRLPSAFLLCSYNSFSCLQNILKFPPHGDNSSGCGVAPQS